MRDMYVCTHVYMYDGSSFPLRLFLFFFSLKIAVRSREFGVVAVGFCVFFVGVLWYLRVKKKKEKRTASGKIKGAASLLSSRYCTSLFSRAVCVCVAA